MDKLIINNRLYDKNRGEQFSPDYWKPVNPLEHFIRGDYATPEGRIPPNVDPSIDWETCETLNNSWGFNQSDTNWKTTETLIHHLVDIASKGGNLLLNVGPTAEGLIPQPCIDRLANVGAWIKANGEAIYGTGRTPFGPEEGSFSPTEKDKQGKPKFIPKWDWRCTTKPGKLYLIIFKWPINGTYVLPSLPSKIKDAHLLANGEALSFSQSNSGVSVKLPSTAPDPIASVVVFDLDK